MVILYLRPNMNTLPRRKEAYIIKLCRFKIFMLQKRYEAAIFLTKIEPRLKKNKTSNMLFARN